MPNILHGSIILIIYFVIAASVAIACRLIIKIPDEIFRKALHFILLGSVFIFAFAFDSWWASASVSIAFAVVVYPCLALAERIKKYSQITTERKKGELKASLLLVFFTFALIISVCLGIFKDRYLIVASVLAWGVGDAFAALIGKKFGRHKITLKYTDGKKSVEGSLAMFITSFISVLTVLIFRGGLTVFGYIITPVAVAAVSAVTELYSKNGYDTAICPLSAMVTLIGFTEVFGV